MTWIRLTTFRLLAILGLGTPATLGAAEYYLDPIHGSMEGDGSAERPWASLQEVAEAGLISTAGKPSRIVGGDTLYLRSGYHGALELKEALNSQPITVRAEPGRQPRLSFIDLLGARHWVFQELSISLSHGDGSRKRPLARFRADKRHGPCSDIVIENCELFSAPDISDWSAQDWRARAASGVIANGERCRIISNRIRNIRFGVISSGSHALVSGNRITNFSGDGIRGLGDFSTYEYNIIENAFKVDNNHDDGFQSWSTGPSGPGSGVVRGVTLRGNTFINTRDPNQPLQASFQGIGCFDGMFEDWVIENNVVCVNHYHGITLMGAVNCRIVNNTVVDMYPQKPGPSWIRVAAHKNGTPSSGNLVANNLASAFNVQREGVVMKRNKIVNHPTRHFVDPQNYDFRLRPDSSAIGKADPSSAPAEDITRAARDSAPDLGAYEHRESDPEP